jgi:hypothetical protein
VHVSGTLQARLLAMGSAGLITEEAHLYASFFFAIADPLRGKRAGHGFRCFQTSNWR